MPFWVRSMFEGFLGRTSVGSHLAVKELKLSCRNPEAILFAAYSCCGYLNYFLNSNPASVYPMEPVLDGAGSASVSYRVRDA